MVESPLVLWESDWINAESLARGRIAVHVTGRAVTQRTTIVSNARHGGIHSSLYQRSLAAVSRSGTLALLVHHDDADRVYAYDGGAEKALQLAPSSGWVVVSMKNDFKQMF